MSELKKQAIEQIAEAMKDNSLIMFVGAGISIDSGLPSWSGVINELKKELSLDDGDQNDDYLKIPQYYYDTWGKQRYFQKITDIFSSSVNALPNKIHDCIFDIQPKHLITTNYDSLLEDKMNSLMAKYEVVKSDTDIPYSKSNHYLIKMHGDLYEKNIVLKEDDYSDYEKNFGMVSTLIKSLMMNHTLLFLGYSLNDSTFNKIFRLIQSSFAGGARKAFFFTPTTQKEPILEYYKNKGIYVISGGLKKNDYTDFGKATIDFLSKISDYKKTEVTNASVLWKHLKFLDQLHYVDLPDVAKFSKLGSKIRRLSSREIVWSNQENPIFEVRNEDKLFEIKDEDEIFPFLKNKTSNGQFLNLEINSQHDSKANPILEPAYSLYKEGNFFLAKQKFREIANQAFLRKDYWNYFIAELNVQNMPKYLWGEEPEIEELASKSSNLDDVINNLVNHSDYDTKNLAIYFQKNIRDLNFMDKKLTTIDDLLDKLRKERHSYLNGGFSANNNLAILASEFESFINFIQLNCVCVDGYSVFKLIVNRYFEALLIGVSNQDQTNERETDFPSFASTKVEFLDVDDAKIIIPNLDEKLLNVLLDSYSLSKIPVSKDCFKYIASEVIRISSIVNKNGAYTTKEEIMMKNSIAFLYVVKQGDSDISTLIDVLEEIPILFNNNDTLRKVLILIIKMKEGLNENLMSRISSIIVGKVNKIYEKNYKLHINSFSLYLNILNFISKKGINFNFKITPSIIGEVTLAVGTNVKNKLENRLFNRYLVCFYKFFKSEEKLIVDKIFQKYESLCAEEISEQALIELILGGVYQFESLSEMIFDRIYTTITTPENPNAQSFPNPKNTAISYLLDLYQKEYFDKDKIKKAYEDANIKGDFPEIDWLIFDEKSNNTIYGLVKNFGFPKAKKLFCTDEDDENMFDTWAISQITDENSDFQLK